MSSFFRKELLYASIVCLMPLGFGFLIAYPSPAAEYIRKNWSKTPDQWKLFVAITLLTAAIGPYIPSLLFKVGLGRRLVTSIVNIISIILWLILSFMTEKLFWMGFVIRILQGLMLGAMSSIGPLLLLEVSPLDQTGIYGTFNQTFVVIGAIINFLIGEYFPPYAMCITSIIGHVLQLFLIWIIPVTAFKEQKQEEKNKISESIFQKKYAWLLFVLILIMIIQQFSGINAIIADLSGIFARANIKNLRLGDQSAIATTAQLFACFCSGPLVKCLGRKAMWTISCLLCASSLICFGFNSKFNWTNILPVILIFLYQFGFGLGLAPLPWFSSVEMFPIEVRPMVSSINGMVSWVFSFVIVYASPAMQDSKMGEFGLFLFYGITTLLGTVFGYFFIVEPANNVLDNSDDPMSEL
ncbi:major facilitator superfamily protein [Trichomonas vaginalis G3]|uniref:Major facilitator superfamily protein n=1 Tax=Trichomonas vaginalis (strain ATCC PRA-98 / G3) TaxID=412133 RepID=A2EQM6_TRIV3|nr:major facilitator superfamily transporter [Trichomonas vaginalis G3]EAY05073.1 major facilitator superfamily protein [Trichomonas vaginalis G3]KAI5489005.1 glucose import [Trichomonas vaginalis G3]|eukprot:XP_001317296.1 major facilitator superfamily transporter [Trichomonas vaginalis G3]